MGIPDCFSNFNLNKECMFPVKATEVRNNEALCRAQETMSAEGKSSRTSSMGSAICRLSFLAIFMLLASCTSVRFVQPQPAGKRNLSKFPARFVGRYVDEISKDTLTLLPTSFIMNGETHHLSADSLVLRRFRRYYIVSMKSDERHSQSWEVFPVRCKRDTLAVYAIRFEGAMSLDGALTNVVDSVQSVTQLLEKIVNVTMVNDSSGKLDYRLIDPTRRQLAQLLKKGVFTIQNKYRKLK